MTSTPGPGDKVRVAVLGGGVGAVTAAFELTRPEHEGRYEVTVYQLGWRLGGKGASGRGPHGRIEEHGLHIWFGFYENAFRCLRACYDELGRGDDVPIRSVDEAFHPAPYFGVTESRMDRWVTWTTTLPDHGEPPWAGDPAASPPATLAGYVTQLLRLAEALVRSLVQPSEAVAVTAKAAGSSAPEARRQAEQITVRVPRRRPSAASVLAAAHRRVSELAEVGDAFDIAVLVAAVEAATTLEYTTQWSGARARGLVRLLDGWVDRFEDRATAALGDTPAAWRVIELMDALVTVARGLVEDGVVGHAAGLACLDNFDLREWLYLHGARRSTIDGGLLRAIYDLVFAYRDGRPDRPALSAAQGLRGMFRMFFGYKGAFAYRMQAGMGDVVFAPYYEVLARRGVRFEFFHEVVSLVPSADDRRIDEVVVAPQARTVDDKPYEPLRRVRNLPCWPSQPDWTQIVEEGAGRARDFESPWPEPPRVGKPRRLRDGVDFDEVVFGLSLGPVPSVCAEIVRRRPAWRRMVDEVGTVCTQALQIWLTASTAALGGDPSAPVVAGYLEPFDTWADMSELLGAEDWPAGDGPAGIHYFCSVLPEAWCGGDADVSDPLAAALGSVRAQSARFLSRDLAQFLPGAVESYPTEFRWEVLAGSSGPPGRGRLASQHVRANVAPSERYVQSLPGTDRYRLAPDDSGYENLALAGDWTNCGFNAGCVEAATMAGLLAARAVIGCGADDVIGLRHP